MVVQDITNALGLGNWVNVEIFYLRAGKMIRIDRDKVQRRKKKDGSQEYYLKGAKETLEPQEFENIYVGSKGEEVLKMFSPTKGVFLPINFIYNKVRDLTADEQKELDAITDTNERAKFLKKKYAEMYEAYFESKIDADTLNHAVYKLQKNALRLQGGGMDMATKLTLLIVFMIIVSVISSWVQYNYFIKPGMEFWNTNSGDVLRAKELDLAKAQVEAGYEPEPIPVEPVPVEK